MDGIKCMLAWMADDEANYSADELRAMAKKALGVYEQSLEAARSQVTADEAIKDAVSVISSINYAKHHRIKREDGEVLYGQTGEWCEWAINEVLPKLRQLLKERAGM